MTNSRGNLTSGASIFKNIKKILVIKFRHIGDVLLTVPAIRALKETFPDSGISVLVNSGTKDVLAGNPIIDELIVFDRAVKKLSSVKRYKKEIDFLKGIRARDFDLSVDLTGGDRAAIVSFLSGARYRIAWNPGKKGFTGKRFLYTHLADIDKQKHIVLQNLEVLKHFSITTDNTDVNFFIPEDARLSVKKIFKENDIKDNDTIIHVHPTSRWLFKCWKDEYLAEVISWLIDKGIKVVITSAPDKKEMEKSENILSLVRRFQLEHKMQISEEQTEVKKIRSYEDKKLLISQSSNFLTSQIPDSKLINLCGKITIKELGAVSELSDLFLGVDSAPMHIAAAVKTPVIALFGATDENVWGPYGKGHIVITKNLPCKPCKKGMCQDIQLRECMTAIKPDDVKGAVSRILDEKTE